MFGFLVRRLLLMLPTLLGITLVTFLLMEAAPSDRAEIELQRAEASGERLEPAARARTLAELRERFGLVDPRTHAPVPVWRRYRAWLVDAARLRFCGSDAESSSVRQRLHQALPLSLLLGGGALGLALLLGVPFGVWLGRRAGSRSDRLASSMLFVLAGTPEFLLATLLVLLFCGVCFDLFPSNGLRSDGAERWSWPMQVLDLSWHMCLPVLAVAVGPLALVARFLRESVSRAAAQPFVLNLRALGSSPIRISWRLLRVGLSPLATLIGSLVPMLVAGSLVVENVFALDGLGRMAVGAMLLRDQGTVMAVTVLVGFVTLGGMLLSDLVHALVDPRVRLRA